MDTRIDRNTLYPFFCAVELKDLTIIDDNNSEFTEKMLLELQLPCLELLDLYADHLYRDVSILRKLTRPTNLRSNIVDWNLFE